MIDKNIISYVENNILPKYNNFDKGHGKDHINDVVKRSLEYYELLKDSENLDINMIYVIACYHDIGMLVDRDYHPMFSADILFCDEFMKNYFSKRDLLTMCDAVEDHSTSSKTPPRSIYGKIVSDADKDRDVNTILIRGYEYTLFNNRHFYKEQHIDNLHQEIVKRYGDESIGGQNLVKFYIDTKENKEFLNIMKEFANDKYKLIDKLFELDLI